MEDHTHPAGVLSFLDTDLYKLTMQNAVLRFFPSVPVSYSFKNRTPNKKLNRESFEWLETQIMKLGNIELTEEEEAFLKRKCTYLGEEYIGWLKGFRLRPREQVVCKFFPEEGQVVADKSKEVGEVKITISGLWVDTILYEIPILALTSEAYFKFVETAWTYNGQGEKAYNKAMTLLEGGCQVSEFGTRRRRDYHTQALVFKGLVRADADFRKEAKEGGKIVGTSNVHLAMRFGVEPIGTVAHEWFMGVAAVTGDYSAASELALKYWVRCFGIGVLGIALTDTFGTPIFLMAFNKPIPDEVLDEKMYTGPRPVTYAQAFKGVRQDSGDPTTFVERMRDFYDSAGIKDSKTIVFSDSLNIDTCLEYRALAEKSGFTPSFGVGTFFTNDFANTEAGGKSVPLNIVIKLATAEGNQAVKISDDVGKNTGDEKTVRDVKEQLGYVERESWTNEATRWGVEGEKKREKGEGQCLLSEVMDNTI